MSASALPQAASLPSPTPLLGPGASQEWPDAKLRRNIGLDRAQEASIKARAVNAAHGKFGWARVLIIGIFGVLVACSLFIGAKLVAPQAPFTPVVLVATAIGMLAAILLYSFLQSPTQSAAAAAVAVTRRPLLPISSPQSDGAEGVHL